MFCALGSSSLPSRGKISRKAVEYAHPPGGMPPHFPAQGNLKDPGDLVFLRHKNDLLQRISMIFMVGSRSRRKWTRDQSNSRYPLDLKKRVRNIIFWQARKEMTALFSDVIRRRRAEKASGAATVEKTDVLQVRPPIHMAYK